MFQAKYTRAPSSLNHAICCTANGTFPASRGNFMLPKLTDTAGIREGLYELLGLVSAADHKPYI